MAVLSLKRALRVSLGFGWWIMNCMFLVTSCGEGDDVGAGDVGLEFVMLGT